MNIDPRLERLQSLIEQKRIQHSMNNGSAASNRTESSFYTETQQNLPVKYSGSNDTRVVSWRKVEPQKEVYPTARVTQPERTQSGIGGLSKLGMMNNTAVKAPKQGEEHLGRVVDLYA